MEKKPPKLYGTDRPTFSTSRKNQPYYMPKLSLGAIFKGITRFLKALFPMTTKKPSPSQKGPQKTPRQTRKKNEKLSIKWILIKTFATLFIWLGCFGILGILWFSYDLPNINRLQMSVRKASVTIQAKDGTIIGTYGDLFEDMVKINELPPYVPQAFMAIEDRRFYSHFGVDLIGLGRAAYTNYRANRVVQGGSTLTQQLAKNFLFTQGMYEVNDRSLRRKIQEAIMAVWLEWKFSKEQIFTMYLNRVYFGSGTYGIEAASRKYFNKSSRQLTVYESAVIAGLLKAPSRYSPANSPQKARERATIVLNQMVDAGYIKSTQDYLNQQEQQQDNINMQGARFFADWVYESIPGLIGPYDQDLIVMTTFDPVIQKHAEVATKETMEKMAKEMKTTEISLVAMTPKGAVKAMIGGMNYTKSQYNRVTQALRQPGSAFKPFVYLAALEAGFTPDSIFSDTPITIGKWSPKNFRTYKTVGEITLRQALTKSVNAVTVRITQQVGAKKISGVAQRLGITSDMITDMSICLGTTEVTLLELVSAYATFANQGKSVWGYGITEIRNRNGEILYQREGDTENQVIDPTHVRQMNDMLMNVVNNGTGRAAKISYPVAGKTGSNGDRDAWFVGFTSDLVAGIWTGNDNNVPMNKNSTGGRLPAKTFSAFMGPIVAENPPENAINSKEEENDPFSALAEDTASDGVEGGVSPSAASKPDAAVSTKSHSDFNESAASEKPRKVQKTFDDLLDQVAQD